MWEHCFKRSNKNSHKNPRLTGNNQYEDMDKRFTMNDVPSGEELFDAIKCNINGLVKGYYRVSLLTTLCYYVWNRYKPISRNIKANKSLTGQNAVQQFCMIEKAKN